MKVLNFEDFMKYFNLRNNSMNESQLLKIYKYPIYPRDKKIYCDKGFENFVDGSMNGTHRTCFIVKDNKSYYFDSFGG